MRHAAFNGRGQFLSASDPQELIDSLTQYIADIQARTGTAAAVSFNSTNLNTGTRVFQSIFDSSRWSGDLLAKDIVIDWVTGIASISGTAWQASTDIDSRTPASRQIITYDGITGNGVNFEWGSLNSAQQKDLRINASGGTDSRSGRHGPPGLSFVASATAKAAAPAPAATPTRTATRTPARACATLQRTGRHHAFQPVLCWPAVAGLSGQHRASIALLDVRHSNRTAPG